MALLFVDGFDSVGGTTSSPDWLIKWDSAEQSGLGNQYASTEGRFGGGAMVLRDAGTSDDHIQKNIDFETTTHVCIGFWFKSAGIASTIELIHVLDTPNSRFFILGLGTSGLLTVTDYASTGVHTVRGTGTKSILDDSWHWIELRHLAGSGSAGEIELYIDGAQDINETSISTIANGTGDAVSLRVVADELIGGSNLIYIDDLIVYDNSTGGAAELRSTTSYPAGPLKIETVRPDSTGANAGFTSNSTAANWENVDDAVPDDDTSYNSSTSYTAVDTFGYASLTSTSVRSVLGVQINGVARKEGANTILSQHVVISSGSTANGPQTGHGSAYARMAPYILTEDPATSTAWTTASLDAVEFGYATSSST